MAAKKAKARRPARAKRPAATRVRPVPAGYHTVTPYLTVDDGARAIDFYVRAFGARECLTEPRDKLRLLSLGNPICCPSVMLNLQTLGEFRFPQGFQTNLDWMAWLGLARRPGGFVYVRERLVSKGVHPGSETTATIANRAREREDRAMFDTIWPRPVAAALAAVYRLGYRANRVGSSHLCPADAEHPARDQDDSNPLQR